MIGKNLGRECLAEDSCKVRMWYIRWVYRVGMGNRLRPVKDK